MKIDLNGLALIALIIAAPGFAAEPDPHAGHHPAPSAATPALPPKAEATPAPSPGMMNGMGGDSTMPMQGMMGGSMPMEGHQHMMDHMATMHGMSPSMMIGGHVGTCRRLHRLFENGAQDHPRANQDVGSIRQSPSRECSKDARSPVFSSNGEGCRGPAGEAVGPSGKMVRNRL